VHVKWRHGHCLGTIRQIEYPTPSIDAYLLEEQSCQISSRSDLKRRSIGLFEEVTPTRRFKLEIDLVQKILKDYTTLTNSGKSIVLCWIPSHVNIPGNERADAAAKSALSLKANSRYSKPLKVT